MAWNEFQFALTLTASNSNRTLPIALYYFKSQFASDYGAMFAATMVVIIPQHRGVYPAAKAGDRGLGQRGGQGMSRIDPLNVKRQEGTYL